MKKFLAVLAAAALCCMAGCRSMGYSDQAVNNSLTPDVSQKEYVRTYPDGSTPAVTQVKPASTDPASPDYNGSNGPASSNGSSGRY